MPAARTMCGRWARNFPTACGGPSLRPILAQGVAGVRARDVGANLLLRWIGEEIGPAVVDAGILARDARIDAGGQGGVQLRIGETGDAGIVQGIARALVGIGDTAGIEIPVGVRGGGIVLSEKASALAGADRACRISIGNRSVVLYRQSAGNGVRACACLSGRVGIVDRSPIVRRQTAGITGAVRLAIAAKSRCVSGGKAARDRSGVACS